MIISRITSSACLSKLGFLICSSVSPLKGGPGTVTKVLAYHIYNKAFKDNAFGYASALSIVLFLIVLAFTLLQFKVEKKFTNDL